jgi:hypothetical protein
MAGTTFSGSDLNICCIDSAVSDEGGGIQMMVGQPFQF